MNISRLTTRFATGLCLCVTVLAAAHAQTLKIGVIAPLTGGGAPCDTV